MNNAEDTNSEVCIYSGCLAPNDRDLHRVPGSHEWIPGKATVATKDSPHEGLSCTEIEEAFAELRRFYDKHNAKQALCSPHDRCETLRELLKVIIERGDFYSPGHSDEKCIRAVQRAKELLG